MRQREGIASLALGLLILIAAVALRAHGVPHRQVHVEDFARV
jgi:hypothetical protein